MFAGENWAKDIKREFGKTTQMMNKYMKGIQSLVIRAIKMNK